MLTVKKFATFSLDPEIVAMKMHGVIPSRVVLDFDTDGLADLKLCQVVVMFANLAIKGPSFADGLTKLANRP